MDDWLRLSGKQRRKFTLNLTQIYGWNCCICGLPITARSDLSCQHVKPRSKGGVTTIENCRPAHRRCNSSVGNRSVSVASLVHDGLEWFARFSDETLGPVHPAPAATSPPKHAQKKGWPGLIGPVIYHV